MRIFFSFFAIAILLFGGWSFWGNKLNLSEITSVCFSKMGSSELPTFEIRYSADAIMETHRSELIKNDNYRFLETNLIFYPYLLMKVKYIKDNRTEEGDLLFSLSDGEMVLDSRSWEKTHGYQDCLLVDAEEEEFKILKAITEFGGFIDKDKIAQKFKNDPKTIEKAIESCTKKNLIVLQGNKYRLHLRNPIFAKYPVTYFAETFVTHKTKSAEKARKNYSTSEIISLTKRAFGSHFAIRSHEELFLPVYSVKVQNPDGSILTTEWNALTGAAL
jgi:hypothetical protein